MKKQVIDLNELSKQLNVPMEENVIPDGRKMIHPKWGKEDFQKAMKLIGPYRQEKDTILLVTNSPDPWITVGLINGMKPVVVNYLYPRPDGEELEMPTLKRGKQEKNYDVVFEIIEKGDKLFINMNSDGPGPAKVGPHTFDTRNLPKVMIPNIPSGKDVFIHAKGMYCVMVCVALNYITGSKSVSIASHDTDYFCGYSSDPKRQVGDVEKRTLPNNL